MAVQRAKGKGYRQRGLTWLKRDLSPWYNKPIHKISNRLGEYNFNKGDTKMDFCWKGSKHSTIFEIHLCTLTCKPANNLLTCFDYNGNLKGGDDFKDAFKLIGWELFEILWTISRKVTTGIHMYIHVCTYDDTPPHSFHIVTVSAGWDPGPAIRDLGSWISNLESRRFQFRFVLGTSGYNEN